MFAGALRLMLLLAVLILVGGGSAFAGKGDPAPRAYQAIGAADEFVPGELVVRFRAGVSKVDQRALLGASRAEPEVPLTLPDHVLVRVPEQAEATVAAALERRPEVLFAEPNYVYRLSAQAPNDPLYSQLWGMPKISAPSAWDVETGSRGVVVAVIDSGVAYGHPDLAPNMWSGPGGVHGRDFVDGDFAPLDENGHGTHVAGTIGAKGNNALGVAGVNWDVSIMAVRGLDANGSGTTANLAQAIDYACRQGADVINGSFGGSGFSNTMAGVITSPACRNTLHVYAAGNSNVDLEPNANANNAYPCEYHRPPAQGGAGATNVICVAATTETDARASFSNYGATAVHVAAPGRNILSAWPVWQQLAGTADGFEGTDAEFDSRWGDRSFTAGDQLWQRSSAVRRAGTYSATDSPSGNYADDTRSTIRRLAAVNLAGRTGCRVDYWMRLATEFSFDSFLILAGTTTATPAVVGGWWGSTGGAFVAESTPLSPFNGQPAVYLRFGLESDETVNLDGVYLDDVFVKCLNLTGADYLPIQGTSMATPHVAGVAALVLAATSGSSGAASSGLGVAQLKAAILGSVDSVPGLIGVVSTGGRLDARAALDVAATLDVTPPDLAVAVAKTQKLGVALKKGVKSRVTCANEDCKILSQLVLAKKLAKKLKLPVVVGKTTKNLSAGATTTVTTKFTKKARKKLAKMKAFKATLRTRAADADGNAKTLSRAITFRR